MAHEDRRVLWDCCGTSNCAAILFFKQGSSYDKKETDVFGLEVCALVLCSNYSWLLCTAILIWLIGGCVLSKHGLMLPHSSQICYLWDKVTGSWLKTKSLRILPIKSSFFLFFFSPQFEVVCWIIKCLLKFPWSQAACCLLFALCGFVLCLYVCFL